MKKSNLISLTWLIPFTIGSIGFIIAPIMFFKTAAETLQYEDFWLGIFYFTIISVVIEKGVEYLSFSVKEWIDFIKGFNRKKPLKQLHSTKQTQGRTK